MACKISTSRSLEPVNAAFHGKGTLVKDREMDRVSWVMGPHNRQAEGRRADYRRGKGNCDDRNALD